MFRSRYHFRVPSFRLGPLVVFILVCLVAAGLVALAIIEPRPQPKHFEVPVPNERFSR
jgi:hypothetical protein